jgi:hypothetical protein
MSFFTSLTPRTVKDELLNAVNLYSSFDTWWVSCFIPKLATQTQVMSRIARKPIDHALLDPNFLYSICFLCDHLCSVPQKIFRLIDWLYLSQNDVNKGCYYQQLTL